MAWYKGTAPVQARDMPYKEKGPYQAGDLLWYEDTCCVLSL